jgi:diacylglycerol kinase
MENKWRNDKFTDALKHALDGIKYTFKTQRNLKIQIVFAILAIILGFLFHLNIIEFAILIITISLVFFSELINTAIETVVDLYTEDYNEKAKIAKDVSAGAVTIMAINSIIIGAILFGSKILIYFWH